MFSNKCAFNLTQGGEKGPFLFHTRIYIISLKMSSNFSNDNDKAFLLVLVLEVLTCPKKKNLPPITWILRDEQGFTILSAPLGGWRAVPGKAVACTVISCTGWYHRPSNCTNYYLSLESGKGKCSAGETLQDALETGKATSPQQRPGSKAASATHLPYLAPYLADPH